MGSSNDLFLLVKSLTKSEKRFFKRSAAKYGDRTDNNSMQLFDHIDSMTEYNEKKLKKKLGSTKLASNLASEKKHLHTLILKIVAPHSSSASIARKLDVMMSEIHFLLDKGLFDQCSKLIRKVKTLAEEHEQFYMLFEVFEVEAQLLMITSDIEGLNTLIEDGSKQVAEKFNIAKTQMEYLANHYRTFIISRTLGDDTRDPKVLKAFKRIHALGLYGDESKAKSVLSKHYFHFMHALYYRQVADWKNNFKHTLADAELYEQNPEFMSENLSSYISALSNVSLAELELMEYDKSIATLQKLRSLDLKEPGLRLKADSIYFPRMAGIFQSSGQYNRITEIVKELDAFVRSERGKFSEWRIPTFYHNTGYCYFGLGKFRDALHWSNRLLNEKKLEHTRPNLFSACRLFYLVIHFELGNDDLMEHLLRSTERDLARKGKLYEIEQVVLRFFHKVLQLREGKERTQAFREFGTELEKVYAKENRELIEYFDYRSWIDSKLTQRPFMEVVQANVKAKKEALMKTLAEK